MTTLNTSVDAPKCRMLKSAMQRATEAYDRKVLRRLALNGPECVTRRPKAAGYTQPGRTRAAAAAKRTASQERAAQLEKAIPTVEDRYSEMSESATDTSGLEALSAPSLGADGTTAATNGARTAAGAGAPSTAGTQAKGGARRRKDAVPAESEWLERGLHLAKQVDGHTTFTHALRHQSHGASFNAQQKAKNLRVGTNSELRVRLKDVEKQKRKIESALAEISQEHRTLGRIKHFIVEIRNIVDTGALMGCRMRQGLRESRPASERPADQADDLLVKEARHCCRTVDEITKIVTQTDEQLARMAEVIDELHADLEGKAETMRVYEQLLSLDGSSSVNLLMGGSAADQPPLEILLDAKAKQLLREGERPPAEVTRVKSREHALCKEDEETRRREATGVLIERGWQLLTSALAMRKEFKKKLIGMDERGRQIDKAIEDALKNKVTLQRTLIDSLTQRLRAAVVEREKLEAQADQSRQSLDKKNQEKDVVCKRLHLRRQLPHDQVDPHHDKVTIALEKEFDVITTAVHDCTAKIAQLVLEVTRMQRSEKALRDTLANKQIALKLDEQCLALPFYHKYPMATQLYNGICSGYSSVYGCTRS